MDGYPEERCWDDEVGKRPHLRTILTLIKSFVGMGMTAASSIPPPLVLLLVNLTHVLPLTCLAFKFLLCLLLPPLLPWGSSFRQPQVLLLRLNRLRLTPF